MLDWLYLEMISLFGELTALEALARSIIDNEVSSFLISVPNPNDDKVSLDLSCNQYKTPVIEIDTSNGSPYITVDVYLFAKILSIDNNTDYLNDDFLDAVADSTNNYLSSRILEYLYKTSTEFRASINDFDKFAMRDFVTNGDWELYNWMASYPSSVFEVRVHTKVNSSLLLTNS